MWVAAATPEVNAESQYPLIIAVCVISSFISTIAVLLRFGLNWKKRGLNSEDWVATVSMILALAYSILCIFQTKYGLGLPLDTRPKASFIAYTRLNFAGRPLYQLGIGLFKIALLISYMRLLSGTGQVTYRVIVRVAMVVIFLLHLACAFGHMFACTPVDKSWHPLKEGSCLKRGPYLIAYALVAIVSDIVVVALPVPLLLKLSIDTGKKIGLICLFALGLFTTLCSILRYLQINNVDHGDGNTTMLVLWGVIEFNVGNLVTSLPFLAPMFVRKVSTYRSKLTGDDSGPRPSEASERPRNSIRVSRTFSTKYEDGPAGSPNKIRIGHTIFHPETVALDTIDEEAGTQRTASQETRQEW